MVFQTAFVILALLLAQRALAHRLYFEQADITADNPWPIDDPTTSTALYATLEHPTDVDYFVFEARRGETVLLGLTIPQIEGQDDFAPSLALIGPGFPADPFPSRLWKPNDAGVYLMPPTPGPATPFFEPFSRTSYWERQEERVIIPIDSQYLVAVWHDEGRLGRYVLAVGDKERLGGDLTFPIKMRAYWTPVLGTPGESNASSSLWQRVIGWLEGIIGFIFDRGH